MLHMKYVQNGSYITTQIINSRKYPPTPTPHPALANSYSSCGSLGTIPKSLA